jgi:cytochrome P450
MGTTIDDESIDDFNLTSPTFFADGDPEELYARMRAHDPVHWTQGRLSRGFWSVFRYKDAHHVYANDNRTFSIQESGNVLPAHPDFEDPANAESLRLTREGANLSSMDGDPHTILRKTFSGMFGLPNISKLENLVRGLSVEILNQVLPNGSCDFATDVAARLPLMVIADIMDIPRADWDAMYDWNNQFASPDDPEFAIGTPLETMVSALTNINGYCLKLALDRRRKPGTDLISLMAQTELDGAPLSDERLAFNGLMFFAAGHETTRNTLCAGLEALCNDPAEFAKLRSVRGDPSALKVAVEEFVRWATPLNHQMRTAMEDTRLGDQEIKAGELVVVWNLSANRDELAFKDAGRFDSQRRPNAHLGFGFGKHFCLGAHLARLEMRVMLEYLLEHMQDIEMTAKPDRSASNLFPGIKHMPIRFRPAPTIAL